MTILIALMLTPLLVLTFCFAVQVLLGLRPLRTDDVVPAKAPSAVIIVPAHDEAALLRDRLRVLSEAARGHAEILLVADNCSDNTAEIGRAMGVETIERHDADRRGKGFALDFARQHLVASPPDVVLIIDADCATDSRSIDRLIRACAASGRPCQATYLQMPSPGASPVVQLSTFAFYIKNLVRQRGLQRLAGFVNLVGTGMALPWGIAARAKLATASIVEDLQLGQELAAAGHPPMLVEDAVVWGQAETKQNSLSQRRRWEGGFLQTAARIAPGVLAKACSRGDMRGVLRAIDLAIPPFALLIMLDIAALAIGVLAISLTAADAWPVLLLAAALLFATAALLLAWATGGSQFVTPAALLKAPLYFIWKIPMYLGFIRKGAPSEWIRTERDA